MLNIALSGKTGISVSGSEVSGAVTVVATHTGAGAGGASFALARVNPNVNPAVEIPQAFMAVGAQHGDEDVLTARGDAVVVSANAPGTVQTVLTPGTWVALNSTGMGRPGFQVFTVSTSPSPAALPAAAATQSAIEFGFNGPNVLHSGTTVRAQNAGFLVHMIDLIGLKSKAVWPKVRSLLLAGAGRKAFGPYLNGQFISLLDPASPGAMQQQVLNAKPGFYVEACFMDTQDHRQHTQVGMERLVQVK